jgi:hypothetical protein
VSLSGTIQHNPGPDADPQFVNAVNASFYGNGSTEWDGKGNNFDSQAYATKGYKWPGSTAATGIKINFQPAASAVPSGYLPDDGSLYAARGNGQTYGWSTAPTSVTTRSTTWMARPGSSRSPTAPTPSSW